MKIITISKVSLKYIDISTSLENLMQNSSHMNSFIDENACAMNLPCNEQ